MLFKDISYLELWQPVEPFVQFHEEQFCEIILNLDQWFRRKCRFISYLQLCQGSGTICATLVEGIMSKFCEIILNLDLWFRRCRLKDFISRALPALIFS